MSDVPSRPFVSFVVERGWPSGRNQKATITVAEPQWKASIAPEMAQKLVMLLG